MQVEASGSTATDGSEQTLATVATANKVLGLIFDANAMVAGDEVEVRIKTRAKSGGTTRLLDIFTYRDAQSKPVGLTYVWPNVDTSVVTIKRVAGTDRTYDWSVFSF